MGGRVLCQTTYWTKQGTGLEYYLKAKNLTRQYSALEVYGVPKSEVTNLNSPPKFGASP